MSITDGAHTRIPDDLTCTCTVSDAGEQQINSNCPDHGPRVEVQAAAMLMRQRADDAYSAVDDGDWRFENTGWNDVQGTTYTVENDTMKVCEAVLEEPAVHITSWHPRVAYAVANLLDIIEAGWEDFDADGPGQSEMQIVSAWALNLARAYHGRPTP